MSDLHPEIEIGARELLPTMVWYTEAEGPHHVSWNEASMAQRDCARDTFADILEAVVASGEVVAKTDLREIRWCVEHDSKADESWCEQAELLQEQITTIEPCRIVSAGLYLEGETE